ncbi:hypothetical protein D3C71_1239440 [compost metagenome]
MSQLPEIGTTWTHYKGAEYEVYDLLNTDADPGREIEHPVIVCYRGKNGKKWGKTLEQFLKKMTPKVKSAWDRRRDHYKTAFGATITTPPNAELVAQAVVTKPTLLGNPEVIQIPVKPPLELMTPIIRLWEPEKSQGVGAFAHVHSKQMHHVDSIAEFTVKTQFVRELWEATASSVSMRSFATEPVISKWAERIPLTHASMDVRDHYYQNNVCFIGQHGPHRPNVTRWSTSYGGGLMNLVVFMSILRHVFLQFRDEVHTTPVGVRLMQDAFNEEVGKQVAVGRIHHRDAPSAVFDNGQLMFLLPRDILGEDDDQAKYATTNFDGHKFNVVFPLMVMQLIVAVFGDDCLEVK